MFRAAEMAPYSANVAFVLYQCRGMQAEYCKYMYHHGRCKPVFYISSCCHFVEYR